MSDSTSQKTAASETSPARSLRWVGWVLLAHLIIGVLLTIVFVKIVPEFRGIFEQFDAELPPVSELVIVLSNLVILYWYLLVPPGILADAAILFGLSRLPAKARWLSTLWVCFVVVVVALLVVLVAVAICSPLLTLIENLK